MRQAGGALLLHACPQSGVHAILCLFLLRRARVARMKWRTPTARVGSPTTAAVLLLVLLLLHRAHIPTPVDSDAGTAASWRASSAALSDDGHDSPGSSRGLSTASRSSLAEASRPSLASTATEEETPKPPPHDTATEPAEPSSSMPQLAGAVVAAQSARSRTGAVSDAHSRVQSLQLRGPSAFRQSPTPTAEGGAGPGFAGRADRIADSAPPQPLQQHLSHPSQPLADPDLLLPPFPPSKRGAVRALPTCTSALPPPK